MAQSYQKIPDEPVVFEHKESVSTACLKNTVQAHFSAFALSQQWETLSH